MAGIEMCLCVPRTIWKDLLKWAASGRWELLCVHSVSSFDWEDIVFLFLQLAIRETW